MQNEQALTIRVAGRVQGVGFRVSTKMLADRLDVRGDVANLADGSVLIHAVATPDVMATFTQEVKKSPSQFGRVATYEANTLDPVPEYDGFQVVG